MIRHLLAKDVRAVAPYLWLLIPAHVLWCLQAFLSPGLYFWFSLVATLAWALGLLLLDWYFDTDRLTASLPATRSEIVTARYASALSGLALGGALYHVYGRIASAVAAPHVLERWGAASAWAWASAEGVLAFFAMGYVVVIGFMPFYHRWGLPLGGLLFSVCAIVTGLAAGAAGAAEGIGSLSHAPDEMARAALVSWAQAWGSGAALTTGLAVALMLGLLSWRLSIQFYDRRDL